MIAASKNLELQMAEVSGSNVCESDIMRGNNPSCIRAVVKVFWPAPQVLFIPNFFLSLEREVYIGSTL